VSWLLQQIASCSEDRTAELEQLQASLIDHCKPLWPEFANGDTVITGQKPPQAEFPGDDSPAAEFHAWAAQYGVCSAIQIASFGGLRGCAAVRDISPGDLILSIPQSALIYDDTVKQTDLGRMLMALPGLSMDNLLIIFTMCDRFDPDSAWAPFWRSLPDAFFTGLSFPPDLVGVLEGSAACLEMRRGQAHLRAQFEATRPLLDILLQAYPQYLERSWFEYDKYVWAAELWYSYAFEVRKTNGSNYYLLFLPPVSLDGSGTCWF